MDERLFEADWLELSEILRTIGRPQAIDRRGQNPAPPVPRSSARVVQLGLVEGRWSMPIVGSVDNEHAESLPFELRYVKHSCDPNVFFDVDAHELLTVRDIAPGDEFTFFYPSTEWSMSEPFRCCCGSPKCVGHINGAAQMPTEILDRYELSSLVQIKRQRERSNAQSR